MKTHYFLYLLLCFFKSLNSSEAQGEPAIAHYAQFYVFDVGQGNSQLVIYSGKKIGFLYDAGSSSYQKHVKFSQMGEMDIFLERSVKQKPEEYGEVSVTKKQRLDTEVFEFEFESDSDNSQSVGTSSSNASNNKKNATRISIESIKAILINSEIKKLFVFLSHADKDHISLLSSAHDIIPHTLQTIIFACGNFLTENQDVKNFYSYVLSKENINLFLPYSWGRTKTSEYIGTILRGIPIIQEDFFSFITRAKEQCFYKGDTVQEHIGETIITEQLLRDVEFLEDKLFIWGVNISGSDPNTQSAVISFKVSSGTSLILTGDATTETFKQIKRAYDQKHSALPAEKVSKSLSESLSESSSSRGSLISAGSAEKHQDISQILGSTRILVVPHHGSEENISKEMIELFQPNLAIISAANGMQYSHPMRKVYEWLKVAITNPKYELIKPLNQIIFLGKYKSEKNLEKYYDKTKKTHKKERAVLKNGENKIISTNYSGTIKYENGNFFRTFSPIATIEGILYSINLKARV